MLAEIRDFVAASRVSGASAASSHLSASPAEISRRGRARRHFAMSREAGRAYRPLQCCSTPTLLQQVSGNAVRTCKVGQAWRKGREHPSQQHLGRKQRSKAPRLARTPRQTHGACHLKYAMEPASDHQHDLDKHAPSSWRKFLEEVPDCMSGRPMFRRVHWQPHASGLCSVRRR